jgi:hypothetical protein
MRDAQMALVTGSSSSPSGYEIAASDTVWEERYLQLAPSPTVHMLDEFGDSDAEVALSPMAISEPFRVLSDEGAAVALRIARELERQAIGDARSKRLRGCTYRSQFFAGLYSDPRLIEFLSDLAQADLREHPIGHHQVQLNFAPEELSKDVDVWHYDVVAYDFVMILTDPAPMKGGNTEFFRGTIEEGMRILSERGELPSERIGKIEYPGPGWAFLQQGHRILHRAASLQVPYPRISLVASYYCADAEWREPTILSPLRKADGRDIALVEWANYAAYRTVQRLQSFLARQPDFSVPLAEVKRQLAECLADAERAIEEFDSTDPGSLIGLD